MKTPVSIADANAISRMAVRVTHEYRGIPAGTIGRLPARPYPPAADVEFPHGVVTLPWSSIELLTS